MCKLNFLGTITDVTGKSLIGTVTPTLQTTPPPCNYQDFMDLQEQVQDVLSSMANTTNEVQLVLYNFEVKS
jgi:hypothetical protein